MILKPSITSSRWFALLRLGIALIWLVHLVLVRLKFAKTLANCLITISKESPALKILKPKIFLEPIAKRSRTIKRYSPSRKVKFKTSRKMQGSGHHSFYLTKLILLLLQFSLILFSSLILTSRKLKSRIEFLVNKIWCLFVQWIPVQQRKVVKIYRFYYKVY